MLNYESHQDTAKKLTVKLTENGLIRSTMRVAYAKMGRQEQVAPLIWQNYFFLEKNNHVNETTGCEKCEKLKTKTKMLHVLLIIVK